MVIRTRKPKQKKDCLDFYIRPHPKIKDFFEIQTKLVETSMRFDDPSPHHEFFIFGKDFENRPFFINMMWHSSWRKKLKKNPKQPFWIRGEFEKRPSWYRGMYPEPSEKSFDIYQTRLEIPHLILNDKPVCHQKSTKE